MNQVFKRSDGEHQAVKDTRIQRHPKECSGVKRVRRKIDTAWQTCGGAVRKKSTRWLDQAKLGRASLTLIRSMNFILRAREGHETGKLCNQMHISEEQS